MQTSPNIIKILFVSILIDFLEFTIILPLLPKILTYYGSGTGENQVRAKCMITFFFHTGTIFIGLTLCCNHVIGKIYSRLDRSTE